MNMQKEKKQQHKEMKEEGVGEGGEWKKLVCVPDNDANILRFLSIAGGNARTETGEF